MDYSNTSSTIDIIRNEVNHQLNNMPLEDINNLSEIISNCKKNIYFTGIGKSESIAFHTCSLLKSIGVKCYPLNCINSLHGDIGSLTEDDIVILFSKSGNTSELINLIPFLKLRRCTTIGICCNEKSKFKNICDLTLILPMTKELEVNKISSIPTNSYMSQLIFCNILTTNLIQKKKISIFEYKENHPAGNIGKNLMTINDILLKEFPKINLGSKNDIKIHDILLEMTNHNIGCCFFMKEDKLYGILTDGDIRRLILENNSPDSINVKEINTKFNFESDKLKFINKIVNIKTKKFIPVIENDKFIGIISYRDILN